MPIHEANSIPALFRAQELLRQPALDDTPIDLTAIDPGLSDQVHHVDRCSSIEDSNGDGAEDDERLPHGKRRLQHVSTLADRHQVECWMKLDVETNGEKKVASRAVHNFPAVFRSAKKANLMKTSGWWKERETITVNLPNKRRSTGITKAVSSVNQPGSRQRVNKKAMADRGPKREAWAIWLYEALVGEFDRVRKAGLKFSPRLLRVVARNILQNSTGGYHSEFRDPKTGKRLEDRITPRWIQSFQQYNNIVTRAQTGKLMTSPLNQLVIEKRVAFHLGQVTREFNAGMLDEELVENLDEAHFIVNVDNGKTLGFRGDESVKYADVVSGRVGMTMVVRIRGGKHASIEQPFMIFQNESRNYPIRGVPDNIPGVAYRTGPKGWMDKQVMVQYLQERRTIARDRHGRQRVIFMDNCGGHNETPAQLSALEQLNTVIQRLPKNSTDLCQPCESWIIQKIKDVWTEGWELEKMRLTNLGLWKDGANASGKLPNPGKPFFLELAANAVRTVNKMKDRNGVTYPRKAMIKCGLALDLGGSGRSRSCFQTSNG